MCRHTRTQFSPPTQHRCHDVDELAEALGAFRALTHLDVSYNHLSQAGVQHLAARLHHCTSLRALDLGMCVRANYTHTLAGGLGRCTGLTRLSLNYNNITCAPLANYARALHLCRLLVLVDLTGNAVHCVGARCLAASLEHYAALAELVLPFNYIASAGARALLAKSAQCPTLVRLDLSNNLVGRQDAFRTDKRAAVLIRKGFERLLAAARLCTGLRTLNLAYNHLTDTEKHELLDGWGADRGGLAVQN